MGCKKPPGYQFPGTLVIDNREKKPYRFADIPADKAEGGEFVGINSRRGTLVSGDYSIDHMTHLVAVERKSKVDFYGTLGKGRARFERELDRLNQMDVALVIVEAEWSEVLTKPPKFSRVLPKSIHRSVLAFRVRYPRVQWDFVPGREFAERTTFRFLQRFWIEQQGREGKADGQ